MKEKLVSRARGEEGVAMIMVVIILFVLLGIGAALMATAGNQQRSAFNQQSSESAYALADAALNAQVFALTQKWPTQANAPGTTPPNLGYPNSCNASSNRTTYCPSPGDLSAAYPVSSGTCPSGTQGDAWNNGSSVTNGWTTYVRDAGASGSSAEALFSGSTEENDFPFDASGSGAVWVRAVGIVNCHIAVVITKVSEQVVAMNFPGNVLTANNFSTGNNGNKTIVNTEDANGNTSQISLRCAGDAYGNGAQPPNSNCSAIGKDSQIAPVSSYAAPAPTPTLSASALAQVKALAMQEGTYYPANDCNFSNPNATGAANGGLAGSPVYITGPCNVSLGPVTINGRTSLGFVVLVNGTWSMTGNGTYWGVLYAANQGGISGDIVTLGGDSTIVGGIDVDGGASLNLGDSGNGALPCSDTGRKCGDLEFDKAAFENIDGLAGARSTPNSFRQLPDNQ